MLFQSSIISFAAMEPTPESTIDVSSSLALEDPTNMQGASSNMEDVNLSHDDRVDLNTQTEVNVKDVEESIGVSSNKIWVISLLLYPEFSLKFEMQAHC